ncbi:MAG TPA: GtrA family protein [Dongiaceae bacterium]|nr:GtrA family protein [Dongiaceae bacterium]
MNWIRWGVREFANYQFGLFLVVGTLAAVCNWASRVWLSIWLAFTPAVCIAYSVGLVVAFFLNCWLVFPHSAKPWAHKAGYFMLWNLFTFPLVVAISYLLRWYVLPAVGIKLWVEGIAHALGLAFPTFLSFLAHKYFTFGRRRSEAFLQKLG